MESTKGASKSKDENNIDFDVDGVFKACQRRGKCLEMSKVLPSLMLPDVYLHLDQTSCQRGGPAGLIAAGVKCLLSVDVYCIGSDNLCKNISSFVCFNTL